MCHSVLLKHHNCRRTFDNSLHVAWSTLRQEIAGILGEIDQIMRLLKKAADIVVMRWIGLSTD